MKTKLLINSLFIAVAILVATTNTAFTQDTQDNQVYIQLGHSDGVTSVAYSPDGRYVLSGSADGTMKLWEVSTGRELRTITGHLGDMIFSPDGRYVLSGGPDNTLKLWEVSSGREVRTFTGHTFMPSSVAFSPDGRYTLSGYWDGTLKLWEVSTGRELRTFSGHSVRVASVTFSPDGRYALSGSGDKLKLWEVSSGREVRTFTGHSDKIHSVAFSPDGEHVLSGSADKTMKLWEVSSGRELRTFTGHLEAVNSVAFSPGGEYALTGSGVLMGYDSKDETIKLSKDNTIKLWEVSSGRELRTFTGHGHAGQRGQVNSVAFSPDGRYVLSGSTDMTMKLWEVLSGREVRTFRGHLEWVNSVAFSPDGEYALSGSHNTIKLWEVSSGRELRTFTGHSAQVMSVALSSDGRYVLSGSADNTLKLWEVSSGRELRTFTGDAGQVISVAFSPNGQYALSGGVGAMKLWEVSSGRELRTFTGPRTIVTSLAFSPDGRYALSVSMLDKTMKLWEVSTGREIRAFTEHIAVESVAFSPDGRYALSNGVGAMKLWEVSNGREVRTYKHSVSAKSVSFSPDGRYVLSGGIGGMQLWEVSSGREVRTFTGHAGLVRSVAFSPDGRHVLSGSNDGTTRIWDVQSGKEVVQLASSGDEWVAMTPEGYYDASENGADLLSVRIGNEVFSMDNFFETYYRPDIVRAKLAGEDITPLIDSDIRNITALPPTARFTTPESNTISNMQQLTLTTEITDQGGGIDEVRLYHNGKVISTETRGFKVVSGSEQTITPEFNVNLLTGENTFRLIAFSKGDRIESNPATLTVNYEGAKSNTRLFTLIIGINEYKNPRYSLNYARSDASGFEERIIRGGESIFDAVVQTTITDAEATKQNIFAALEKIKSEAGPEDMFVFYYAGHGVMSDGVSSKAEFFMAPTDVTQLYGNEALLKSNGISASEIQEYSRNIKAQKQLFVLDACQSGAATEMLAMRGAREEKAIAQLARSTGTFWLTASGSEQFATEFAELGHGVFTYALLEGLNGNADQGTKDGKITVQELSAFLNDRVPELSQIHKGQSQYPSSYGYGQDFPLVVVE